MMTEPIHFDRPVAGVGLAGSFGESWTMCQENEGEKIGFIPCAEGGSSIDEWSTDGLLFRHAISQAKFAMENSELIGVLWHQGESDSQDGKYKEYYKKLSVIFNEMRKELGVDDIPFIVGGLCDFLGKEAFGAGCVEFKNINEELMKFADENENCFYVTGDGLKANPDGIHIDAESLRIFGVRYYEVFSKKTSVMEPLQNEKELVNKLYERDNTKSEKTYMALEKFSTGKMDYKELMSYFSS